MTWSRRQFLAASAKTLGYSLFLEPLFFLHSRAEVIARSQEDPHFFLQIVIPSGLDCSYFLDARPLTMSTANEPWIQNYHREPPEIWTGKNGQATLASTLVRPLKKHFDSFSILNGVMMSHLLDGHEQVLNSFFTGEPLGGSSFIPHLNRASSRLKTPVDAFQMNRFAARLTNAQNQIPFNPVTLRSLTKKAAGSGSLQPQNSLFRFLLGRYEALGKSPGLSGEGARDLHESLKETPALSGLFKSLSLQDLPASVTEAPGYDPTLDYEHVPELLSAVFRNGLSRSAILSLRESPRYSFDCHDPTNAKKIPGFVAALIEDLALLFQKLRDTPFDSTQSVLDVTTVVVFSEFNRTLRQEDRPIDSTGTDHNALSNTFLIGGKRIKPGLIYGETDLRHESDFKPGASTVSGAHLERDPKKIRTMGRPFDFSTSTVRRDLPKNFLAPDYLSCGSIVNTIYSLFDCPRTLYRKTERLGPEAPVLTTLLS